MHPLESIEHEPQKPDCGGSQGQSLTDESGRTPNPGCHAPAVAQAAKPQRHTKVGHGNERKGVTQPSILNVGPCRPRCLHWKSGESVLNLVGGEIRARESWTLDDPGESPWALPQKHREQA